MILRPFSMMRAGVSLLITAPDAAPAIGDVQPGGFYAGAIWDTVTYSGGTYDLSFVEEEQTLLFPLEASAFYDPLPFYNNQLVRIAPRTNTNQVFIDGIVTGRSVSGLSVYVSTKTGETGTYSDWVIAARWKVIVAPKSGGESASGVQFKTGLTAAPAECLTLTNGRAATAAMVAANVSAGSAIYPAANFVQQINLAGGIAGDGFVDRYLPARDELELLWRHFKPITNNNYLAARGKPNPYVSDCNIDDVSSDGMGANRHAASSGQAYTGADPAQTALTVFRSGGDQALSTEVRYWSCSKSSVGYAWTQTYFAANPGWQRDHGHTNSFRVRAVRREIY